MGCNSDGITSGNKEDKVEEAGIFDMQSRRGKADKHKEEIPPVIYR